MKRKVFLIFALLLVFICTSKTYAEELNNFYITKTQVDNIFKSMEQSNIKPFNEENVKDFIYSLENEYSEGMKWAMEKKYLSIPLRAEGHGCSAFGLEISDKIFGTIQEQEIHHEYEKIKTGDLIDYDNLDGTWHMVIVIEKDEKGITVVEGNNNGKIKWGRYITKDFLESHNLIVHTRYP